MPSRSWRLLRLLCSACFSEGYGFPFVQVGEGHDYMGAECIPIATTSRDIAESIFRLDFELCMNGSFKFFHPKR